MRLPNFILSVFVLQLYSVVCFHTKPKTLTDDPPALQIERFNAKAGTHTLFYEDGEIRDSDMSQRGFRVCYRPPGWTPPRLSADPPAVGATAGASSYVAEEASAGQQPQDAVWGRRRQSPLAPRPPADFSPDTSAYVLAALNRFGEAGGMAPLARRLSSGRAPFGEVLETFRLGKALRTHASSRAVKEVNWALKECAAAALLSAPPESMRATTKAEIAECVSSMRQLALTLSSPSTAANPPVALLQELEQLELALAMKVSEQGWWWWGRWSKGKWKITYRSWEARNQAGDGVSICCVELVARGTNLKNHLSLSLASLGAASARRACLLHLGLEKQSGAPPLQPPRPPSPS